MKGKLLPPKYYNLFLLVAFGLHIFLPIRRLIYPPVTFFGIIGIICGFFLNIWSVRVLTEKNTTIDFYETTTILVTNGPFQISRNPIYLSGVILFLGIAILLGSLITFLFPITLLIILDVFYIPFEERKLERIFGEEYLSYRQKVRRWI
ncbi:MAG: methyltransferase family protein [Candidatus Hodarchaeales archaeon]|jgi:protein-S-isoprenylcysteine O-methyltransferase Ste14